MLNVIEKIIACGLIVAGSVFISDPMRFRDNLRKIEVSILKEVSRTDNWGDPLIWRTSRTNGRR